MTTEHQKKPLMDRGRIQRSLKRMAYQIAEKTRDKRICLVGLNERGLAVAREIHTQLKKTFDNETVLYSLDVLKAAEGKGDVHEEYDFEGATVILIDDVIFSGKMMFTALQLLIDRPDNTVYTAVLVDRGNRRLPVAAEFVGMEIPSKTGEHVEVTLEDGLANEVFFYKEA